MTVDRFSVAGKTVVVTGASSGIGRTVAEQFAAGGADVVVCSREQEHVDPVAEGINARDDTPAGGEGETAADHRGGRALAVECDVRDRDAVAALVDATVEEFGGIDVLVNNAGASFVSPFEDISPNGWGTIVDSNLTGTYHCSQVAGEQMRADGGGVIVNVASVAGQRGAPYMSHYGAAKAGIINLTTTLAYEWASEGVRVNCVSPGFVATPGVESQMGIAGDDVDRDSVERRMGLSEEIADVVQFLASPASSYLVGETVTAQGLPRVEESPEIQ